MSDKEEYNARTEKRSRSRSPVARRRRSRSRSRSKSSKASYSRSRSRSRSRGHRSRSREHRRRSRSRGHYRSRSGSPRRNSHSRSPMSNRRRHLGNREDPTENTCLGIFGLSLYTNERDVREVFGRYGPLENINVVHDHQTGRSRGFAFVTYETVDDAKEAKDKTNGIEIDGRRIRVDFSITKRAHTPTPGIYMGKPTRERGRDSDGRGGGRRSMGPVRRDYHGYYGRRSPSPEYRRRSPSPYNRNRRYSRSRSRSPKDYRRY